MFKKLFILLVSSLITAPVLGTQGTHEQALLMLQQLNAEISKKVRDQESEARALGILHKHVTREIRIIVEPEDTPAQPIIPREKRVVEDDIFNFDTMEKTNELLYSKLLDKTVKDTVEIYFRESGTTTKSMILAKAYKSAKKAVDKELLKIKKEIKEQGIDEGLLSIIIEGFGGEAARNKIVNESNRIKFIKQKMEMGQQMQTAIEKACKAFPDSDQE